MPGKPVPPGSPLDLTEEEREELEQLPAGTKKSLVTLRGLTVGEDGNVYKSKYFDLLSHLPDDYSDIEFTPEEARKVKNQMTHLSTGTSASTPLICTPKCPWKDRCVYWQLGKPPYGRSCLVEINIMKNAQLRYLEEYDVDPHNYTEWTMVNQLAEIEVMLWRINQNLAKNPNEASGVVEQNIGISPHSGEPITRKEISQFFELQDKLYNRKDKLVKRLVGDRQEKYKMQAALKKVDEKDPSTSMSQIRQKLESATRKLDQIASENATPVQLIENKEEIEGQGELVSEDNIPFSPDDVTIEE